MSLPDLIGQSGRNLDSTVKRLCRNCHSEAQAEESQSYNALIS
jgi:hypothetical protein